MSTDAQSTTATQLLVQANVAHSLKVESRDGDQVGSVYALMVHKGTGRSTHAVLSLGGFLGMGERYVAVSPSSVALGYDADAKKWKAIIGATKDQLKSAPEFKYDGKFKR